MEDVQYFFHGYICELHAIISSCKRKKDTIKDQKKKTETGWEMLLLRIDKIDVLLQIYMVIFFFFGNVEIFLHSLNLTIS